MKKTYYISHDSYALCLKVKCYIQCHYGKTRVDLLYIIFVHKKMKLNFNIINVLTTHLVPILCSHSTKNTHIL